MDFCQLDSKLILPITTPSNPQDYEVLRKVWNTRINKKPLAIVRCVNNQEIIECINFARENHLSVTIKNGGFGACGYCIAEGGITLDLQQMNRIDVDLKNSTMNVQAGALTQDILNALMPYDYIFPLPNRPAIGITGFTLGGGIGNLARSYGLSCDNLLSAEIITSDGCIVNLSLTENNDLFWALCGSGGGQFGVITRLTFKLHKICSPYLLSGTITWPWKYAEKVINHYISYLANNAPNNLDAELFLCHSPTGDKLIKLRTLYNGSIQEGEMALESFYKISGSLSNDIVPKNYFRHHGITYRNKWDKSSWSIEWKNGFLAFPYNEIATIKVIDYFSQSPNNYCSVWYAPLGGAIAKDCSAFSSFAHRDKKIMVNIGSFWQGEEHNPSCIKWAKDFYEQISPFYTPGTYINSIDDSLSNWTSEYYGNNYSKLVEIKKKYDPHCLFRQSHQNIGDI